METNEMSNENQTVEQSALADANGTPPAGESAFSPEAIAAIAAQRSQKQQVKVQNARLEGELAAYRQLNTKAAPAQKSPLEVRAEEEGVSVDDVQFDGALYRKQQAYDKQVVNAAAKVTEDNEAQAIRTKSKEDSLAKNPDWDEVVAAGENLLTKGEFLDLQNAGVDFGEQAYAKCKAAIARSKPKTDEVAPKKEPSELEEENKVVPTRKEILATVGGDPVAVAASQL